MHAHQHMCTLCTHTLTCMMQARARPWHVHAWNNSKIMFSPIVLNRGGQGISQGCEHARARACQGRDHVHTLSRLCYPCVLAPLACSRPPWRARAHACSRPWFIPCPRSTIKNSWWTMISALVPGCNCQVHVIIARLQSEHEQASI